MTVQLIASIIISTMMVSATQANAECPRGTDYRINESPNTLLIKRVGAGKSRFTRNGPLQFGIALDLVTSTGQRGALFGPTRSYMFMVENADVLTKQGYQWEPASPDPGGFFRVLSDDGQKELFHLTYVGCHS